MYFITAVTAQGIYTVWRVRGETPHSSAKLESDVFAADVPAAKTLAPLVGTEAIEKFYAIIFQIPHSP